MPSLSERLKQAALTSKSPSSSRPSSPDQAKRSTAAAATAATPESTPPPDQTSTETDVAAAAGASFSSDPPPPPPPSEPEPALPSQVAIKATMPATKPSPKLAAAAGPKANGKGSAAALAAADTSRSSSQPSGSSGSGHGHSSSFDFHLPHLSLPSFPSPFAKRASSPSAATAQGPNVGAKELATLSSSTNPAAGRGRPQQSLGAFFSLGGGGSSSSSSASLAPVAAVTRETRPEMIALPPSPCDVKLPLPEEAESELLIGEGLLKESPEEKLENDEIRRLRQRVGELETFQSSWARVIRENTPLEDMSDAEGLENHLRNLAAKVEMSMAEMQRVYGKLKLQEARQDEMRETHALESSSHTATIDDLRASLATVTKERDELVPKVATLTTERDAAKTSAKEEEEKRTKAISLLKTVRQKLVKSDALRDEALAETDTLKAAATAAEENGRKEAERLKGEVEKVRAERERDVRNLRDKFEQEVKGLRTGWERESRQKREEAELRAVTIAATNAKEVSGLKARIDSLQTSLTEANAEKATTFDTLQQRQAEVESAKAEAEKATLSLSEIQYAMREAQERVSILEEELIDARRTTDPSRSRANSDAVGSIAAANAGAEKSDKTSLLERQLATTITTYETQLSTLRSTLRRAEADHLSAEEEWSRNVSERGKEVERMRRVMEEREREYEEALRGRRAREDRLGELEQELEVKERDAERERRSAREEREHARRAAEGEEHVKEENRDLAVKLTTMETTLADLRSQITVLRQANKVLKSEMQKVQSSALLLEKQRNPGIGYWSAGGAAGTPNGSVSRVSIAESLEGARRTSSDGPPASDAGTAGGQEEEVNLEYLRNVILQFLEHKEMRANLVRVLSVILHFTPQETRRLVAKAGS